MYFKDTFLKLSSAALAVCFVSITCTGCIGTKVHTLPVATFSMPYDSVWDRVLVYLNKEKEPIIACDKEKGVISTDWVVLEKFFAVKRYRYDIQLKKISDTQVQVGIFSPQEAYSMGDWEEMLPSERRAQEIFCVIKSSTPVDKSAPGSTGNLGKVEKRPFNKVHR